MFAKSVQNKEVESTLKIQLIIGAAFLTLVPFIAQADKLQPFTSDGCSAFPDGTATQSELWLNCCTAHDYQYWKGGTYKARLASDKALKECVAQVGEPEIALLMLAGIRVGGTPFLPTAFRWGYGWRYPRFYGELTEEELLQVKNLTKPGNISR
jgi:hypothetical protein